MLFFSRQHISILLFHRILPERNELWDPVDPKLFDQVLKYLQKNFFVASLAEVLFNARPLSSKPLVAITFDDGYNDFISYAMPILDKYKMKASMYVASDCIDRNLPTWTYIIDYLFTMSGKLDITTTDLSGLDEAYRVTKWANKQERVEYCKKFKRHLKIIPAQKRNEVIENMIQNFDDIKSPAGIMMSWEDVKQIHAAGVEVGSHSVTHPTLATLEDDAQVEFELKESAKRITEMTGIIPDIFSYPMGSYDERVKQLTKNAGYKAALAVDEKMYDPRKEDIFEVPRIQVLNESWYKAQLRLNGTINFVKQLREK